MELLGGVKAQLIPVLVAALAVHIVVELHARGVLAQELDVDLVPGVGLAVGVDVVGAGAGEEGAGGALVLGGLHADGVVAVAVVEAGAHLAAVVVLLHIVPGGADVQLHLTVVVGDVAAGPPHIEHTAVGPAVRGEHGLHGAIGEVGQHVAAQRLGGGNRGRRGRSGRGGGDSGGGHGGRHVIRRSTAGRRGFATGGQRQGQRDGQDQCRNVLFHGFSLLLKYVAAACVFEHGPW